MRVLLINTSERIGGAAIAASRLIDALKTNGIKAKLLVRDKQTDEITVVRTDTSWFNIFKFLWERLVIWVNNRFTRRNLFAVDIANAGIDITNLPEFQQADIIHLHWINQGMLSLKNIQKILDSGKPVVWTMHDMWPFTGICHHARECTKYQTSCNHCMFLRNGGGKRDLSYRVFRKKQKLYNHSKIAFVACSRWLEELAKSSSLLTGHTITSIPNPINTNLFAPRDRKAARTSCGLPQDMHLILFASMKITDKRKGVDYLIESCKMLIEKHPEQQDKIGVVAFGRHSKYLESLIPFKVFSFEYISSEHEIINIYNAVDLYVTPSLEENLPNTIMEAMACGTPCVGFQVGGIPEMIDHLHNGYVAEYKSSEDLANGIYWVLTEADYPLLAEQASRKVIGNYSERAIAKKYLEVYNRITGKHD
ncbi:glycosyltransferase [Bacteroides sp. 214]|uniref:glycosyltransferase family 4 protein n=1 Tax=Bacteroides sp. 214 TaxID=2302935 RepID=UPI0013D57727|nr:glycosyltransferase family 4 protein [Bacteroides sp. 214]NDW12174.1 glycosyltransferase [Bacteroides sp. 214]